MFNISSGTTDGTEKVYEWTPEGEGEPVRLHYKLPTATASNSYRATRAKYADRMASHIDERAADIDVSGLEDVDSLLGESADELDDEAKRARLKRLLAVTDFFPTQEELQAFAEFCAAHTTRIEGLGGGHGEAIDWQDDQSVCAAVGAQEPQQARRTIVQCLGSTGAERVNNLIRYAATIDQGLSEDTKKN